MAITRFFTAQIVALHETVKPRLKVVYKRSAPLLTKRGQQIMDRALKKGTVGGDVGMQLLFEPAMLLSLVSEKDTLYDLADD